MQKWLSNPVLIIIDVQKGFDHAKWGQRNNPNAETNISKLLSHWRQAKMPVIHVQHMSTEEDSPLRPGQPGNEFKDEIAPQTGEKVIQKDVNSAFIGTDLEEYLYKNKWQTLILVGLTTDHCVSTSTRMAGNLGFQAFIAEDAVATFNRSFNGKDFTAQQIHETALASLNDEFAQVTDTSQLIYQLELFSKSLRHLVDPPKSK